MTLFRYLICVFVFTLRLLGQSGSVFYDHNAVFTVPSGVTSVTIEVLGAGGRGGHTGGGGGGGGGFAKGVYSVTPLSTLQVIVDYYTKSAVLPFIQATNGKDGSPGNVQLFTSNGGQGGAGTGGNIKNSSGGNGGAGWPGYFGGGGGGAAGLKGNGQNGENAHAFNAGTGKLDVPVAKGGMGAGGLTSKAGSGGGYEIQSYYNTYTVDIPPTSGFGCGAGGGGSNGSTAPASGYSGYCFISWGNSCQSPAPLIGLYSNFDSRYCEARTGTVEAAGYDNLEWFTDTLSVPFAIGRTITTPVLTGSLEVFYVRTSGCAQNQFVSMGISPIPSVEVVPAFQFTTICWGDVCFIDASGGATYDWIYPPDFGGSNGFFQNQSAFAKDTVVSMKVIGYNVNFSCPDTATIQLRLLPKLDFTCTASPMHFCQGDTVTLDASGPKIISYLWSTGESGEQIKVEANERPVYFDVTGVDSLGCQANFEMLLQHQSPSVYIEQESDLMCAGDSTMLIALGAGSYSWSSGQAGNPVWVSPHASTVYTVSGNAFGCSGTATCSIQVEICSGLGEDFRSGTFSVYPNPTTGRIYFSLQDDAIVSVADVNGKVVRIVEASAGDHKIDLGLDAGVYILSAGNLILTKIIVSE